MTSYCREIAEEYQLSMPKMNSKYFAYASKSFDFALMAGVIAVALAALLICLTGIVSTSLTQMQRNQVVDTYEAVWLGAIIL